MTKNRKMNRAGYRREQASQKSASVATITIPLARYDYLIKCEAFLESMQDKGMAVKLEGGYNVIVSLGDIPHYTEGV